MGKGQIGFHSIVPSLLCTKSFCYSEKYMCFFWKQLQRDKKKKGKNVQWAAGMQNSLALIYSISSKGDNCTFQNFKIMVFAGMCAYSSNIELVQRVTVWIPRAINIHRN